MTILDKVREAVKKNSKSEDGEKANFNLAGSEEGKIRDFEARAGDLEDIVGKLEAMDIDTREIREKIKEIVRNII